MENSRNSGDNSSTSVDRKKSEKFFRQRPCGSFPGPLEISHVTDQGGGSGRFRGEKQRQVAGNRGDVEWSDSANRVERNDEGQPKSSHSKLSFWVRSLASIAERGATRVRQSLMSSGSWFRNLGPSWSAGQLLTSAAEAVEPRTSPVIGGRSAATPDLSEAPLSRK